MLRSILHCDMNNFYASVECMLDPALKKYPIAVCGSVEERHGIVLAKNYKAKAFDVKTGDAVWQAKQKCKDLVVVPPHYEEYIKYSKLVIIFDVLTNESPVGWKGERNRLYLSEAGYQKALDNQKAGNIKIISHANVARGNLYYDRRDMAR